MLGLFFSSPPCPPPPSPFIPPPNVDHLCTAVVFVLIVLIFCLIKLLDSETSLEPDHGGELPGASLEIEAPVFSYCKDGGDEGGEIECVICLSMLEEGEEYRKVVTCGHVFHRDCIDRWFMVEQSCPLCRSCVCVVVDRDGSSTTTASLFGQSF